MRCCACPPLRRRRSSSSAAFYTLEVMPLLFAASIFRFSALVSPPLKSRSSTYFAPRTRSESLYRAHPIRLPATATPMITPTIAPGESSESSSAAAGADGKLLLLSVRMAVKTPVRSGPNLQAAEEQGRRVRWRAGRQRLDASQPYDANKRKLCFLACAARCWGEKERGKSHQVAKSLVTASIARASAVITCIGVSRERAAESPATALNTATASLHACVLATAQSALPTRAWDLTPPKLHVDHAESGWQAPAAAPGQKRRTDA